MILTAHYLSIPTLDPRSLPHFAKACSITESWSRAWVDGARPSHEEELSLGQQYIYQKYFTGNQGSSHVKNFAWRLSGMLFSWRLMFLYPSRLCTFSVTQFFQPVDRVQGIGSFRVAWLPGQVTGVAELLCHSRVSVSNNYRILARAGLTQVWNRHWM